MNDHDAIDASHQLPLVFRSTLMWAIATSLDSESLRYPKTESLDVYGLYNGPCKA